MQLAVVALVLAISVVNGWRSYRTWYPAPDLVNLHVRQAGAWLRGSAALQTTGVDAAFVDGRAYDPFPPGPALVFLVPVALFGERLLIAPVICLTLSVLNVFTLVGILRRLGTRSDHIAWLAAAFFLGSGYWFTAVYSYGVWHSAHVVAVTFLLAAIWEALGRRRGWVMGLSLGMALLSRQFMLFDAPFVLAAATLSRNDADRRLPAKDLAAFLVTIGACVAGYMLFNQVRFGSPFDTGYGHLQWTEYERERVDRYGVFSPAYVPINLYYLLVPGFHLDISAPDHMSGVAVDWFGSSVIAASPFVFLAYFARAHRWVIRTAWCSIGLIALAQSFYFVNGAGQLNWQRYALDYWPVLFVLIALGFEEAARRHEDRPWKILIAYAVALNVFVLVLLNWFATLLSTWPPLVTSAVRLGVP